MNAGVQANRDMDSIRESADVPRERVAGLLSLNLVGNPIRNEYVHSQSIDIVLGIEQGTRQ